MAFVHGVTEAEADPWFARAGLSDVPRISDPTLAHYRAFGLKTTGLRELVKPGLLVRGAACASRHGFGIQPPALVRQLPGVFVVQGPHVLAAFRHGSPSDRPNYLELIGRAGGVTIR